MKVTQVASRPPSAPASGGGNSPGERNAAMKPTNWSTWRGFRHAEAVKHFARRDPMIGRHRLLRDITQDCVSPAEGHQRHLAEKYRDRSEDVAGSRSDGHGRDGDKPQGEPERGDPHRA